MSFIDPAVVFKGKTLVMVPHMDDGVLACGGTLAMLPDKKQIHIVYSTDGTASPAQVLSRRDSVSNDLESVRMHEAGAAMGSLGIPGENIHFLRFPDGKLKAHLKPLQSRISPLIEQIRPDHVFVPFRYDCHTDHLALHRAVTAVLPLKSPAAQCHEYFVYYRFRLLPQGDVRKYIDPRYLHEVDITGVSKRKRAALAFFKSQTTIYYSWQTRPNLSCRLLDEVSRAPEVFLNHDPSVPGVAVFKRCAGWIRLIHTLEPLMKKRKDQAVALLRQGIDRNGRIANRSK